MVKYYVVVWKLSSTNAAIAFQFRPLSLISWNFSRVAYIYLLFGRLGPAEIHRLDSMEMLTESISTEYTVLDNIC